MVEEQNKPTIDEQLQIKKILKGVTAEKQNQHNQLMNEFKKAHRKMFKSPENECSQQKVVSGAETLVS